ncbi:MAG: Hpt domain-containing protein [Caldimonas sp.]
MSESSNDLSTVSWVHDELRRSIDAAHKALRRFVKEVEAVEGSDVDAVDPSVLRAARVHLHQGIGALELVGLPAVAQVMRASEAIVQRAQSKAGVLTAAVVGDIERASFAVLDYVGRLLAGKQVSPLSLFPQYRAVHEAAETSRVHPADLWPVEWSWREVPVDPGATPSQVSPTVHDALEGQLLPLMRGIRPQVAAARISDLCAGVGAGAIEPEVATLCRLASGMFEAQAKGLLGFDLFTKRVASRLLPQFRILERGESDVSERLARDLLFFCAQSASPLPGQAPRLSAVRKAYDVPDAPPVDYSTSILGRFDPALIVHARKRVASAKEAWSAVAGGELHRLPGLMEQFSLVAESLRRLFPLGEVFGGELLQAVGQTQQSNAAPPPALAMEVATSLLYIEAALEDGDFDDPEHPRRVQRLADRLQGVRAGVPPEPLEGWMEELYRRVSDRQTIGSVVQELRVSLAEAEKAIDQFFRDPTSSDVLMPVSHHLSAMRGVLSVLGMEHAAAALLRMRDEVDGLESTEVEPERVAQAGVFDRLAGNLSALGFLIDMLSVQPQMAKSLFKYDPATGILSPVMGRSTDDDGVPAPAPALPQIDQHLIEQAQLLAFSAVREDVPLHDIQRDLDRLTQEAQAADQPRLTATLLKTRAALNDAVDADSLATARENLSEALVDYVAVANEPASPEPDPVVEAPPRTIPVVDRNDFDDDDEMREVFLEEANEVIGDAVSACRSLGENPSDLGLVTTLRRAFHTLKGSSRMVGLKDFGEAAWTCEQLYNTHLAEQRAAQPAFLEFTRFTLDYLAGWVAEIGARSPVTHDSATVEAQAAASSDEMLPAGSGISDIALPIGMPPDLPSAFDLDFRLPPEVAPESTAPLSSDALADVSAVNVDEATLAFELDLSALDEVPPANVPPAGKAVEDAEPNKAPTEFDPFATIPFKRPGSLDFSADREPVVERLESIDFDLGDEPATDLDRVAQPATRSSFAADAFDLADDQIPDLVLDLSSAELALDAAPGETSDRGHEEATIDRPGEIDPSASERDPGFNDGVKVIGALRIGIPLFNIYLNEADELSRRLTTELAEWAMEQHRPIGDSPIALAHSLAGSSATVGFADLSRLARLLEHAEMRSLAIGHGTPDEAELFVDTADEIRRLLHQFAAGFLKEPAPELLQRLEAHELSSARRLEALSAADELPTTGEDDLMQAAAEGAALQSRLNAELDSGHLIVPEDDPDRTATTPAGLDASTDDDAGQFLSLHDTDPPGAMEGGRESPSANEDIDADEFESTDEPRSVFGSLQPRFDPLGIAELKPLAALSTDAVKLPAFHDSALDDEDDIDAEDAVDAELFPIFDEEALELIPRLGGELRAWARSPDATEHAAATMRILHTLKGGARLAGALRLGEMAHRLETRIERLLARPPVASQDVEALQSRSDGMAQALDGVRLGVSALVESDEVEAASAPVADVRRFAGAEPTRAVEPVVDPAPASADRGAAIEATQAPEAAVPSVDPAVPGPQSSDSTRIDWARFPTAGTESAKVADRSVATTHGAVRVGAPLLDRLVNLAGEVSVTRSRVEVGVGQIKSSLGDLTENLERLRGQLRDIEIQGETQMSSRLEAAKAASQTFDPLEFDRFTRFQELTRMMAESVNDVATVQRTLQRSLEVTEDELVAQSRMTRELQSDLLRTRMVEFEGISDRLYRVVRLAGKETGKQVRLDIVGGSIEVDRGVLDRMTGAFEHLLRNCVTHGIEAPADRIAAGKEATGSIVVALTHEGNEVGVDIRDDGAGLDLAKIRRKGVEMGLVDAASEPADMELANLIFLPGFSTASSVTELAGRGVGMDVVRSDVLAMGGRIETATEAGKGTSFKLILPLTTAVTQVVMLRCGATTVAVPSTLVETVRRATPQEVEQAYWTGGYVMGDKTLQFFWMGALLQISPRSEEEGSRARSVVIVRSAQQRIAVHVDEVTGNQEVVVKNLGPQLSRLPGLAGMTLLTSGAVALIYNPVALATLYGDGARAATNAALNALSSGAATLHSAVPEQAVAPLVLVVDDSLTVRRVTQRMLVREGFRVMLAKDGLDALERLAEEVPSIVLSDIEMPRMDGFDLVRNIRSDARLREIPVIMITSRIAQKHRDHAAELGVDHYLGKPYSEEDLLALIGRYTSHPTRA